MKTATITVHHVFGTKGTSCATVTYRGKRLRYWMENENETVLCNRAIDWALNNGFTHYKVQQ